MFVFALGLALSPANAARVSVEPIVCPAHRTAVSPKIIVQGGTPATPSPHIIVQGGIAPLPAIGPVRPGGDNPAALGPKQDDPGPPPAPDLPATRVGGMGDPAALGPKQDDPGPPPAPDLVRRGGAAWCSPAELRARGQSSWKRRLRCSYERNSPRLATLRQREYPLSPHISSPSG